MKCKHNDGNMIQYAKSKDKKCKRYFGVDYGKYMKYRDQVVASELYVNENITGGNDCEEQMKMKLYGQDYDGGCDCILDDMF